MSTKIKIPHSLIETSYSYYIEKYGNPLKYAGFLKDSKIKHITNKELKNIRAAGKIFDNKNAN